MAFTEQMTQRLGIQDVLNNVTTSNNTVTSAKYVDMSTVRRALYILAVETVTSGQINAQLQSSAQTNFNVAHNIAGTLTTNINTNNQIVTLEVRADQVSQANAGDRYVRLSVAANGNTSVWAVGLGGDGVQKPASQNNLNSTYISQQTVCNT